MHADLSEYNILYHKGILYIIDVSQSVEHDHPHALDFLRSDCLNITDFFAKRGVPVMTSKARYRDYLPSFDRPHFIFHRNCLTLLPTRP